MMNSPSPPSCGPVGGAPCPGAGANGRPRCRSSTSNTVVEDVGLDPQRLPRPVAAAWRHDVAGGLVDSQGEAAQRLGVQGPVGQADARLGDEIAHRPQAGQVARQVSGEPPQRRGDLHHHAGQVVREGARGGEGDDGLAHPFDQGRRARSSPLVRDDLRQPGLAVQLAARPCAFRLGRPSKRRRHRRRRTGPRAACSSPRC